MLIFVLDEDFPFDSEPFSQLNGESIEYMGLLQDDFIIAISNYRLFATQEDGFYSVRAACMHEYVYCLCLSYNYYG